MPNVDYQKPFTVLCDPDTIGGFRSGAFLPYDQVKRVRMLGYFTPGTKLLQDGVEWIVRDQPTGKGHGPRKQRQILVLVDPTADLPLFAGDSFD